MIRERFSSIVQTVVCPYLLNSIKNSLLTIDFYNMASIIFLWSGFLHIFDSEPAIFYICVSEQCFAESLLELY